MFTEKKCIGQIELNNYDVEIMTKGGRSYTYSLSKTDSLKLYHSAGYGSKVSIDRLRGVFFTNDRLKDEFYQRFRFSDRLYLGNNVHLMVDQIESYEFVKGGSELYNIYEHRSYEIKVKLFGDDEVVDTGFFYDLELAE